MATQLRNCLVRCGASGFAVDYWGHRDFIGAPQKTSSPLPRAPHRRPRLQKVESSERHLGTPRSPLPFVPPVPRQARIS